MTLFMFIFFHVYYSFAFSVKYTAVTGHQYLFSELLTQLERAAVLDTAVYRALKFISVDAHIVIFRVIFTLM